MKLSLIDITIILVYLIATVAIGLLLKKRASKNAEAYMLGGYKFPWYMIGLSNASSMFDISGTMWLVTLAFVYGLKSIWIPWLWPVFNQIFLMVFLAAWLRRSNVKTGAEWMFTRFGSGKQGRMAHGIVIAFAIISCLGFMAYAFIGIGKFVQIFLPWEYISGYIPFNVPIRFVPHFYGIVFTIFAVSYAILGGMSGIIWADVIQYVIMAISAIIVGLIAMDCLASHPMNVPEGWHNPFFGWNLNMDWTGIINEVNQKIKDDGFSLFSIFFMMMLFKGVLISLAGPAPNYDMQKILATKSPKEAAKMSGFVSLVLLPTRYFMVTGFAVLAIIYYNQLNLVVAGKIDFEQILPSAINEFVPTGFMGLLLAGLLAAFMSTFANTLNVAQAYIVNDIYLKYLNPAASNQKIKNTNYLTGIILVVLIIFLGFNTESINSILQWIVSALYGSYIVSNLLKWYWWRFNGSGYFWGMFAGIVPAFLMLILLPGSLELYYFPVFLMFSLVGAIVGTYMKPPTDKETLKYFYKTVRPWGFWKPVYDSIKIENPGFEKNYSFGTDMFNVAIGIVGQTALIIIPVYVVLMNKIPLIISSLIFMLCLLILRKTWWNKLEDKKVELIPQLKISSV